MIAVGCRIRKNITDAGRTWDLTQWGGAFAPYECFRRRQTSQRRGNAIAPRISITEGWRQPSGGEAQKERHDCVVSFFLYTYHHSLCYCAQLQSKRRKLPAKDGTSEHPSRAVAAIFKSIRDSRLKRCCHHTEEAVTSPGRPWQKRGPRRSRR